MKKQDEIKNICAVRSCLKFYGVGNISLFRFPKDYERCKQWVTACNRNDLLDQMESTSNSLYSSYYRICSMHFEEHMFVGKQKKRLKIDAIPTLLLDLPCSSTSQPPLHIPPQAPLFLSTREPTVSGETSKGETLDPCSSTSQLISVVTDAPPTIIAQKTILELSEL
ncbi:hypothetical protein NQ315_004680, partial [Exocentrus adspersus]